MRRKGCDLMDNKDMMKSFFENPYAREYLKYCNDTVRMAVSGITAAIGIFENGASGEAGRDALELAKEQCLNLMRTAEVSTALIGGFNEQKLINLDELLSEITSGCRTVLGEKYVFTVEGERGGYVMGDQKTIKYIFLSAIRNIILNSDDNLRDFEFSLSKANNEAKVMLRCDRNVRLGGSCVLDADLAAFGEILSGRFGGRFELRKDGCELVMPLVEPDGRVSVRSAVRYGDGGNYSPFNVMLGSIESEMPPERDYDPENDMPIFNNKKN